MNGAGKKLWGYYPPTDTWIPLQVDANGRAVADMSGVSLGDLGDTWLPAPGDQYFLYWDNAAGKWDCRILVDADIPASIARDAEVDAKIAAITGRFYALDAAYCIWRAWDYKVSSTPRTATVSSIAGDVITLTANEAYRFGEWGAAPEYMNAASVYIMIRNTSRSENAWVKASSAANKLTVTDADDIAAWVNGNTISTYSWAGPDYEELDISPLIPDGATLVFLKTQCLDTGVAAYAKGLQVSKEGVAGTWSNTFVQVQNLLVCAYPQNIITSGRHMTVRDRATGTDTLKHSISVVAYIK